MPRSIGIEWPRLFVRDGLRSYFDGDHVGGPLNSLAANTASFGHMKAALRQTAYQRDVVSAIHLQRGDEGFLRDVDLAELPHLLLAFLLLLQKFALRVMSPP